MNWSRIKLIFVQSFARWSRLFICWCILHWLSTNNNIVCFNFNLCVFIYLFLFCLFLSSILPFCLIALFIYFYQHILFKCLFIFVLLWLKTLSFSLILALHSKGLCQNFNLFANKLLRRNHFRTLISACEKYLVKGFMLIGYTWLLKQVL